MRIKNAIIGKLPHFFIYAKDKTRNQVGDVGSSVTDRLLQRIQSYKFDFKKKELGTFDYKQLMHNQDVEIGDNERLVIKTYYKMASKISMQNITIGEDDNTYINAVRGIYEELAKYGSDQYITDILVYQLFHNKKAKHKNVFWFIYGDIVYQNLLDNHAGDERMCERCGKRFVPTSPRQKVCGECSHQKEPDVIHRAICSVCGETFIASSLSQTVCPVCTWKKDNQPKTSNTAFCIECGAEFDITNKKGRKPKLCQRCGREHELSRKTKWARCNL